MAQASLPLHHYEAPETNSYGEVPDVYHEQKSTSVGFLFMTYGVVILTWVATFAVAFTSR